MYYDRSRTLSIYLRVFVSALLSLIRLGKQHQLIALTFMCAKYLFEQILFLVVQIIPSKIKTTTFLTNDKVTRIDKKPTEFRTISTRKRESFCLMQFYEVQEKWYCTREWSGSELLKRKFTMSNFGA